MIKTPVEPIKIRVKFFSTLKNIAQTSEAEIELENNSTLREVLSQIQTKYFVPNNSQILKPDKSDLEPGIICLINEADMTLSGGLDQKFKKARDITLISSLHGG